MGTVEIGTQYLQDFKKPETFAIDSEKTLLISNVFGINEEGRVPARFLSGFLSTFNLARTIQEQSDGQVNPHVRIFRPVNIIKYVNGLSDEIAAQQINQGNEMLGFLASLHFPTVEFSIEDDLPITNEVIDVLSQMAKLVELHCDSNLVAGIVETGRSRGGERGAQNAIIYAAHHPFGWGDLHHPTVFEEISQQQTIKTLPPSEERFNQIRNRLKQIPGSLGLGVVVPEGISHELTISMCGTPHYLFVRNKQGEKIEPSLSDVIAVSAMEVLEDMRNRAELEQNTGLKGNLEKAARDLEKVFLLFAKGNNSALREEAIGSLLRI